MTRVARVKTIGNDDITVADYLAAYIANKKVPAVFELSGGMIAFLTDAIYREGSVPIYNMRHEQAAGFAAEGASRITGVPSVAMATSGPGATNLVTAIGSAYFDSTPIVFITGQVHQSEMRKNSKQRQNGFQELNIVEMVKGITKKAIQVKTPEEFKHALDLVWASALSDRPGPVLIDIPIDVQQMKMGRLKLSASDLKSKKVKTLDLASFETFYNWVNSSKRPLILIGGGIRHPNQVAKFRQIVEMLEIPVVYSLMAVDVMGNSSKFKVGMIGSYGNRWANKALKECDTLIVLGSRLDVRQTGNSIENFIHGKKIIRVDIDDTELTGRIKADLNINLNLSDFLDNLMIEKVRVQCLDFLKEINLWRHSYPPESEQEQDFELNPNYVVKFLSTIFENTMGYVVDVGQHQMWAAQSLNLESNQRFLTSGGMGAMGFSIPAAIGCAVVGDKDWVVITGDGCAQLTLPEFETLKQYHLPVIVCIFNNNQLGMVAQFQEENMNSRFIATREGYSTPDFAAIGLAFGIPTIKIKMKSDLNKLKDMMKKRVGGPMIVEIVISQNAKALPKLKNTSGFSDL